MTRESWREVYAFIVLTAAAFVFVSLLTHHQSDYLQSGKVHNACGPVGAILSYQLTVWVGVWGSYVMVAAATLFGLLRLTGKPLAAFTWKVIGLCILVLTVATLESAVAENSTSSTLTGGYYGRFFYSTLLARLNWFGSYLMIGLAIMVSLLISTELRFYPLLARAGQVASNAPWRGVGNQALLRLGHLRDKLRRPLLRVSVPKLKASRPAARASGRPPARHSALGILAGLLGGFARLRKDKLPARRRRKVLASPSTIDALPDTEETLPSSTEEEALEDEFEEDEEYEYDEEEDKDKDKDEDKDEEEEEEEEEEDEEEDEDEEEYDEDEDEDEDEPVKTDATSPFSMKIKSEATVKRSSKINTVARKKGGYHLPTLDHLATTDLTSDPLDRNIIEDTARKIEATLQEFKIEARVVEVQKGPVITQYELFLAAGIKVTKIVALSDDLAMALKAESIRIVAPVPGKDTVGLEVPNRYRKTVGLRELLESREFRNNKLRMPLALGKNIAGKPIVNDLGEMPHLLIAGSTGSGKSVCINSIIVNLLLCKTPDEVKLILIDPKMVELAPFESIPHLLTPVVTDMKKAPAVLNWLVDKMDERYQFLAMASVRHLTAYNALGRKQLRERLAKRIEKEAVDEIPDFLPYIVVIIDELADLMMSASKEVETSITRLSQKSRAVGIHVILATQRPSVDVITGLIKANLPCRISFHVTSKVDSRTILDRNGSDKLLGKGDMLFLPPGTSNLVRAQGTFVSDKDINAVVDAVRREADPQFDDVLSKCGPSAGSDGSEEDALYEDAVRIVLESQRGSVTLLQRQLQIGYTRASRLMELIEAAGLVGPYKGSKAREVYYTLEEWEAAVTSQN